MVCSHFMPPVADESSERNKPLKLCVRKYVIHRGLFIYDTGLKKSCIEPPPESTVKLQMLWNATTLCLGGCWLLFLMFPNRHPQVAL